MEEVLLYIPQFFAGFIGGSAAFFIFYGLRGANRRSPWTNKKFDRM